MIGSDDYKVNRLTVDDSIRKHGVSFETAQRIFGAPVRNEQSAPTTDRYAIGSVNHSETGYTIFPLPSCSIIGVHFASPIRSGQRGAR